MGEGEIKRQQNERSRNAQTANNVSRCEKENRCRATSSMGKGKGCEQITEKKRIVPRPNNGLGFFVPACTRKCLRTFLDIPTPTESRYDMKASTDTDLF